MKILNEQLKGKIQIYVEHRGCGCTDCETPKPLKIPSFLFKNEGELSPELGNGVDEEAIDKNVLLAPVLNYEKDK